MRAITRVTMSKLELLSQCQYWARQGIEWNEISGDDAALGTEVDDLFSSYVNTGKYSYAGTSPRTLLIFGQLKRWYDEHGLVGMRSQVVFGYRPDIDMGREIEALCGSPSRFYTLPEYRDNIGITDDEICGAADLVCFGEDLDGPFVDLADLKVRVGIDVKDATSQLSGLALAAARSYGIERARIRTLVADESRVEEREIWLDAFSLDAIAEQIKARVAGIEASEPQDGEHCSERYCSAILVCPKTAATIVQAEALIPAESLVRRLSGLTLHIATADQCADILVKKRILDAVGKSLGAAVEAFVGDEEHRLEDGSTLMKTYRNMPRTPAGAFEALARKLGATDEDIALCVTVVRENAGIKVVKPKAAKASRKRAA
jgi:hypothetical protein